MLATLGWAVANGGGVIPFPLESGLAPLSTSPSKRTPSSGAWRAAWASCDRMTCASSSRHGSTSTHYMSAGGNGIDGLGYSKSGEDLTELQTRAQERPARDDRDRVLLRVPRPHSGAR